MFGQNPNQNSPAKYATLTSTHVDFDKDVQEKGNHSFTRTIFQIAIVLCGIAHIVLTCYLISMLKAFSSQPQPHTSQDIMRQVSNCSCGATIQEAKTLNCTFDVLSVSWLPPSCRDDELTIEFVTSGPGPHGAWNYWAHENGTSQLTVDEVGALAERREGIVYTSWEFHVLHCSFYWRKQWRVSKGVGALFMEARYAPESHVKHCQHVFMKDGIRKSSMTKSLVRLGGGFF